MNKLDPHRAWRDLDYYLSLSDEERAQLPANPAGAVEVADADLRTAMGGLTTVATQCGQSFCEPDSRCITRIQCEC